MADQRGFQTPKTDDNIKKAAKTGISFGSALATAVIAQAKKEQVQHEEQVQRNQIVRELSTADGLTQGLADLLIDMCILANGSRSATRERTSFPM